MIIICTSELMNHATAEVDRETDIWYEKDYTVQGQYSVMIFPKLHWRPASELAITRIPIYDAAEPDDE